MHDRKLEDLVNHPSHYNQGGIETLDIIKMSLTKEEYRGYLKGNVLKYRERAQFKGNPEQDYAKAKFYFDELKVDLQSVDNTMLYDETKEIELSCPYCDEELTKVAAGRYTCQTKGCFGYLSDFMVLK